MARKSSAGKKPSTGKRNAKATATRVAVRRRVHDAVHRFVGHLAVEVEDAIDAARGRQLAPIRGILKNWRYLWRRYLAPEAVSGQQQTYPKPPIGWADIEPDLAKGLALLDVREWSACNDGLAKVVRALEAYESQPFKRKFPGIITREDADVVPAQVQDGDSEDSLLNTLQQDARKIVALFNKLEDSLAGRKPVVVQQSADGTEPQEPTKEMKRAHELYVRDGLTQVAIAKQLTTEFHKPFNQGRISIWIKDVRNYYGLPPLERGFRATAMKPEKLGLGARKDHRTPRQRKRLEGDEDE